MQVIESVVELRQARKALTGNVGLVPTMGYLHAGHMSLVNAARSDCDIVLVTIFVNPTQFGAGEDLDTYPRDMQRDLALLEEASVDVVFAPPQDEMYAPGHQTWVTVEEVTKGKEGTQRPGHFRGVITVVAKLFNLTQPYMAYFGQKDAQQVVAIRRMVADLNFNLDISVCPIVRESDGLALSSRNVYLSGEERVKAASLNRALQAVGERYRNGERDPNVLRQIAATVLNEASLDEVDYVSLADARTLVEAVAPSDDPLLLSLAAQVGKPRLLDNCLLPLSLNTRQGATATLGAVD